MADSRMRFVLDKSAVRIITDYQVLAQTARTLDELKELWLQLSDEAARKANPWFILRWMSLGGGPVKL